MKTFVPALGAGLGFRRPIRSGILRNRARIGFLELIADHYLDWAGGGEELDLLGANFPLVLHGINLSLGSAEGLDTSYLQKLAGLIGRVKPRWWSEHIAFTKAGGVEIGHLSPLPF